MIKRSDYFRYHELLAMGVKDTDLLDAMVYDVLEKGDQIVCNSLIRHWPDEYSPECPNCYEPDMQYINEICPNDDDDCGYYTCDCGAILGWWEYLESKNWHYTDNHRKLDLLLYHLSESKTYRGKGAYLEAILQFVHGMGPIASWFIQGGSKTISEFRQDKRIYA